MNSRKIVEPAISVIFLMWFVLILSAPIVSADLIVPGQKSVSYCFEISNMADFPDYSFLTSITYQGSYEGANITKRVVIKSGECVVLYGIYTGYPPEIYAIKTADMSKENIDSQSNPYVIPSGLHMMRGIYTLIDTDPTKSIKDYLEIVSITSDKFEIAKSKVLYTYEDGTTEEKTYTDQNVRPAPSRAPIIPLSTHELLYLGVPAAALMIISIILVLRKSRKGKTQ